MITRMLSKNYHLSSSGVWLQDNDLSFSYSDGEEVETRLLKQLGETEDLSVASDELQSLIVDWPSEYHFSPLRANLLSPFSLGHFSKMLEIGSGCGTITRFLGETCADSKVLALEGSLRRAEITRARCRDLENVHVCRDSFATFEVDESFDLITMIGVLEYSPVFFGEDAFLMALSRARSLLGQGGVLVVAIENQLGLKYFNGCAEDHTGRSFTGINDLYPPESVQTMGRLQLQEQLTRAGFEAVEFVYPFPDYKLPQLLLREASFACSQLRLEHLVGQYPARDYGRNGNRVFRESRAWKLLHQNGIVRDLANSFLIFAFTGQRSLDDLTDPWLAKTFSDRRKKQYLVETVFTEQNSRIVVEKTASYPRSGSNDCQIAGIITHHLGTTEYIDGTPYRYSLPEKVSGDNCLGKFILYLNPWVDWLKQSVLPLSENEGEAIDKVPGNLYDCMPANFLVDNDGRLHLIDCEWENKEPLELGYVLFRGIYRELINHLDYFLESTDLFDDRTLEKLLLRLFRDLEVEFSNEILDRYIDLEIDLQLHLVVYNAGKNDLKSYVNHLLNEPRKRKSTIADLLDAGIAGDFAPFLQKGVRPDKLLDEQNKQIMQLRQRVAGQNEQLVAMTRSTSWRLTAPLRLAGYLIKGDFGKAKSMKEEMTRSVVKQFKKP